MAQLPFTNILLADDDFEDREFFTEALKEVSPDAVIQTSKNGVELMDFLQNAPKPAPGIIFLDLNMPLKDGYECLAEIKSDNALKDNVVVIFTTSGIQHDIDMTYNKGANLFVTKPNDYRGLVNTIQKIFSMNWLKNNIQPARENYTLNVNQT